VSNSFFGYDPCPGISKSLKVQATCSGVPEILSERVPFRLGIEVRDKSGALDESEVTIFVKDVNEAPFFESASRSIPENSNVDSEVGSALTAVDQDERDTVRFTLIGGDGLQKFLLDEASGQLFTKSTEINFEKKSRYTLIFKASDDVSPER
jgi:hypothetical protein